MSDNSFQARRSNWRTRAMLAGGVLGSLIGVGAAYLYVRATEETSEDGTPRRMATREAVKLGMALLAIVRQLAELGARR